MNYSRLAMAAVAAWVVDGIYGFIVYGNLLTSQFAAHPGVFRAADAQAPFMPVMFGGILVGMFVAVAIYAKGYEGGGGIGEGLRFGLLIGLFNASYVWCVDYAILNIGRHMAASMACAAIVEWALVGIVMGLVYRPSVAASRDGHKV